MLWCFSKKYLVSKKMRYFCGISGVNYQQKKNICISVHAIKLKNSHILQHKKNWYRDLIFCNILNICVFLEQTYCISIFAKSLNKTRDRLGLILNGNCSFSETLNFKCSFSSGSIIPASSRISTKQSGPLTCTHTAEGHTKAVLSVTATEDMLFTSSKGRAVF